MECGPWSGLAGAPRGRERGGNWAAKATAAETSGLGRPHLHTWSLLVGKKGSKDVDQGVSMIRDLF